MTASRAQGFNKRVDFSKVTISMQPLLLKFMKKRKEASMRDIQKYFSGTPNEFVAEQVNDILANTELITIRRNGLSRRAGYVYSVVESES